MRRWDLRFEWKPADLWIGAFYRVQPETVDVWVCLLPCVPLHLTVYRIRRRQIVSPSGEVRATVRAFRRGTMMCIVDGEDLSALVAGDTMTTVRDE